MEKDCTGKASLLVRSSTNQHQISQKKMLSRGRTRRKVQNLDSDMKTMFSTSNGSFELEISQTIKINKDNPSTGKQTRVGEIRSSEVGKLIVSRSQKVGRTANPVFFKPLGQGGEAQRRSGPSAVDGHQEMQKKIEMRESSDLQGPRSSLKASEKVRVAREGEKSWGQGPYSQAASAKRCGKKKPREERRREGKELAAESASALEAMLGGKSLNLEVEDKSEKKARRSPIAGENVGRYSSGILTLPGGGEALATRQSDDGGETLRRGFSTQTLPIALLI